MRFGNMGVKNLIGRNAEIGLFEKFKKNHKGIFSILIHFFVNCDLFLLYKRLEVRK